MLLVEVDIAAVCSKGANLAELKVARVERVRLSNNQWENRNVLTGLYTVGTPLGEGGRPVEAPIELRPGDQVRVTAAAPQEEREVFDVMRAGKLLWANEDAQAQEEERQRVAAIKIAKRKELI